MTNGFQTASNQLQGANEQLQASTQRLQEFQQQLVEADDLIKTLGPEIKSHERRLEGNIGQLAEMKSMFEEQARRHENVAISIGELARDVGQFKAQFSKVASDYEGLKGFQATVGSDRRMQRFAIVASTVSLLMVVYIGLGKPGWPILAHYLSEWVPGLDLH